MNTDLENLFEQKSNHFYNRLLRAYNIRMFHAMDKEYAHKIYKDYCHAMLEIKFNAVENESIIQSLEHDFRLGKNFSNSVQNIQNGLLKNQEVDHSGIVDDEKDDAEFQENGSLVEANNSYVPKIWNSIEIVQIFSEYIAITRFQKFLSVQEDAQTDDFEEIESPEKTKDFTTARQVLAVHYLLKYAQVKNVDKTEIARFIQFLTGKNLDNIYKKVQNPFKVNDKSLKEDLRFIRNYFEKLGMNEVVRMINGEMG